MSWVTEEIFFFLFVCFIFSLAISCVFISVALLACPLHAVSWQLLHFASCTVMLGQLSRDPDDQTHDMWWFFFNGWRESGCEAGCSCWCSHGFHELPVSHWPWWGQGESGGGRVTAALHCKLMIKQVCLTSVRESFFVGGLSSSLSNRSPSSNTQ